MVTEPLSNAQLAELGWTNRQGLSDIANQFHYYRLTEDNRILWGGYDAIYFWRGKVNAELESRPETWAKLSKHFFDTFPQLEGREVHPHVGRGDRHVQPLLRVLGPRMAGPGRLRHRLHRSGRGVHPLRRRGDARPARRHAGRSPRRPKFVQEKPLPFPPEPFRFIGIQATRWSLDREDKTGKRNVWLRSLDRFGLGFDS